MKRFHYHQRQQLIHRHFHRPRSPRLHHPVGKEMYQFLILRHFLGLMSQRLRQLLFQY
jgi:hypothetical protein